MHVCGLAANFVGSSLRLEEAQNEGACLQTSSCFSTSLLFNTCHDATGVNCGPPESPAQGSTEYTLTEYGAEARYSCNTGYVLSGARSAVCTLDETWSVPPPTCRSKYDSNYVTKYFSSTS